MKRILRSAFSLAAAGTMAMSSGAFNVYAEEITAVYGEAEISEELYFADLDSLSLELPEMPAIEANYSQGTYNYGTALDDNNVAVYLKFMELTSYPSVEPIQIDFPDPVTFTASSYRLTSDEDQQALADAVFSNCKPGMDCATFDMPELFWLDLANSGINPDNVTYRYSSRTKSYTFTISSLTINPSYKSAFSSIDDVKEWREKLLKAIDEFEVEGDTRYEQIKSIHDQISLFTYYDTNAAYASTALGALVEPGVVCEGYSKAFKLICDKLNIPCVLVYGNYDESTQVAHMWNDVLMDDGKWYPVDVTWDDLDGDYGIEYNYKYFLTSASAFYKSHTECEDYVYTVFEYPTLSDSAYDPDWAAGQTFTTTTETTTTTTTETTTLTTTTSTTTTTTEEPTTTSTTTTTTTEEPTTTSTTTTTTTEEPTTTSTTTTTTTEEPTTTSTTTTTTEEPTTTSTTTTTEKPTTTTTEETTTTTQSTSRYSRTTTSAVSTTATTETTAETTTTTETTVVIQFQTGDLNKDGEVNVADLICCANALLGKERISADYDVDGDGRFNVFDMVELRRIISEKY